MDPALFTPAAWPEEEEELEDEEGDEAIKKRLLFDCSETPMKRGEREASKKQSVVVFLRVRPKSQREILSMDADCFHLVGQRELQAVAPVTSQMFKNKAGARCPSESSQLFSFTHIFDAQTSQREVFEESMLPTLRDFFSGQNCLVFTYGVTNSGKTYTVTGTPTEPGILPRSLDLIFNSISPQQLSSVLLRPKNFSEAIYLTEEETESVLARKSDILSKARESSGSGLTGVEDTAELTADSDVSTLSKASSNYSKVSDEGSSLDDIQVQDGSTIELDDLSNVCYSVWVSFTEIYKEFIYDLLVEEPKNRRNRPALKLAEDRNHNHFIKGLLEVQVSSVEEAMLLLKLGLRHRHVASTRLNYQSSRSHTIFTIKLIKTANTERPHKAMVNRISIVDLAGSERSAKTGATGMRMKEASNINASLMTLGKCFNAMRRNQNKRRGDKDVVVPFRESKLTLLFQNYFVGKGQGLRQGKITMLVNVSNNASVFDETSHVLEFSALTSKVIPIVKSTAASRTTTTAPLAGAVVPSEMPRLGRRGKVTAAREDEDKTLEAKRTVPITAAISAPPSAPCEGCKLAKEEAVRLWRKIRDLEVEVMETEYNIRQEVCREFQEQIVEIEEAHRAELEEQREDIQEMNERRLKLLQKSMKKQFARKRRRVGSDDEEEEGKGRAVEAHSRAAAELKDVLETHKTRVTSLNQQINSLALQLSEAGQFQKAARERETDLVANAESLQKQLEMANSKILELTKESENLGSERSSLVQEYEERESRLRAEASALRAEMQEAARTSSELTAHLEEEVEILEARINEVIQERSSVEVELVELKQASSDGDLLAQTPSASSTSAAELSHQLQGLQAQLTERDTEIEALRQANNADTDRIREEYQEKLCSLREELTSVREELSATRRELTEDSQRHGEQLQSVLRDEASKQEMLRSDLTSTQAQLASRQELLYKLEIELEEKETGMEHQLAAKSGEVQVLWDRVREKDGLIGSLQDALREVEAMLESQTAKIGDMNGELEDVHSSNEALQERLVCLEGRLTTSRAEKSSLSTRVEGLTAQVEEGRKMLVQREAELLSSADQCRTILEQQLTDMRSANSSAQQELAQAREEARTLQQQFREKESELLALATSSSEDKTAAVSLSTELQSLRKTLEKRESEHRAQLDAVQGNHQLETSQLRIRVRELVEEEEALQKAHGEEVAQWCEQVDTLTREAEKRAAKLALHEQEEKKSKKSVRDLEGEKRTNRKLIRELEEKVTSLEQQLESLRQEREREREEPTEDSHIYEDPPELSDEPTVYENDSHSLSSAILQSVENKPDRASAHLPHSDSKPFIAILERSSQLMEDTFTEETPRIIIDATPPAGRRGRRAKKPKKRSIEAVARAESGMTPDTKRVKYQLRSHKRQQLVPEDGGENQMPEYQTPVRKAPSLRNIISKSTKKIVALTIRAPSPQPAAAASSPPALGLALRTRRTHRAIRKSQISMPLGLMNSPGPGPKRAVRLRRHQVQPGR